MRPRKLLIVGNYGAGNLGDDAILAGILTDLKQLGYKGEIAVTVGQFKTSSEVYKGLKKVPFVPSGIRSHFKAQKKEALHAIQEADGIIMGGGGLFTDGENRWTPYIWYTQTRVYRKMNKPYICYAQSIGPLRHRLSQYWTKQAFRYAEQVHVRDHASLLQLKKWGVRGEQGTDAALSWLLEEQRSIPKKPLILLCLRDWPGVSESLLQSIIKDIKEFAKKRKWKVILLNMDLRSLEEIRKWTDAQMECFEPTSCSQAFEAIEKAQMVVSMRLHGSLFALAGRTPFIALSYSSKVKDFFQLFKKQSNWELLNLNEEIPRLLPGALKTLSLAPIIHGVKETELIQNQAFLAHALDLD